MFPRANRLRTRAEFRAVYEHGRSLRGSSLHLRYLQSRTGRVPSRVGIVVSKIISKKSTQRNRLRRQLREAMRKSLEIAPSGYDLVLLARTQARGKRYQELLSECVALLRRLTPTTNTTRKK